MLLTKDFCNMETKVEIIAKETIKPSSPTADDHRKYNLSMGDVFGPNAYVSVILFYDTICKDDDPRGPTIGGRSEKLKKSLSDTLTIFYPLAGRVEEDDGVWIMCSDEGAVYVESRVNCFLSDILKQPEPTFLKDLIPTEDVGVASGWPLVLVQANFFECGGVGIGICVSHKICDAASLATFIETWADMAICRGDGDGDGDGISHKVGDGHGVSHKNGDGDGILHKVSDGDGISHKIGYGDGISHKVSDDDGISHKIGDSDGISHMISDGDGDGISHKISDGDGDGISHKIGDGNGISHKISDGHGVSHKNGDGDGEGDGISHKIRDGDGDGDGEGDGVTHKNGDGVSHKIGDDDGISHKISEGDGDGISHKIGDGDGISHKIIDGHGVSHKIGGVGISYKNGDGISHKISDGDGISPKIIDGDGDGVSQKISDGDGDGISHKIGDDDGDGNGVSHKIGDDDGDGVSHKIGDGDGDGISHKISDGDGDGDGNDDGDGNKKRVLAPDFARASSFFPQVESLIKLLPKRKALKKEKCITRRYVFDASNISSLKTQASASSSRLPTRVEAVTALIWKSATKASRSNSGSPHSSLLVQAANLRRRVTPRLSERSIGNLIAHFTVENKGNNEVQLENAIDEQRKAVRKLYEKCTEISEGAEASSELFQWWNEAFFSNVEGRVVYNFSSWSKFGLYETDFGWGEPIWVSYNSNLTVKNLFVLMDTRDGNGIEAWITLSEQDMDLFEKDKDVLAFAVLNPSAL